MIETNKTVFRLIAACARRCKRKPLQSHNQTVLMPFSKNGRKEKTPKKGRRERVNKLKKLMMKRLKVGRSLDKFSVTEKVFFMTFFSSFKWHEKQKFVLSPNNLLFYIKRTQIAGSVKKQRKYLRGKLD